MDLLEHSPCRLLVLLAKESGPHRLESKLVSKHMPKHFAALQLDLLKLKWLCIVVFGKQSRWIRLSSDSVRWPRRLRGIVPCMLRCTRRSRWKCFLESRRCQRILSNSCSQNGFGRGTESKCCRAWVGVAQRESAVASERCCGQCRRRCRSSARCCQCWRRCRSGCGSKG
jgi:hypothetical protein